MGTEAAERQTEVVRPPALVEGGGDRPGPDADRPALYQALSHSFLLAGRRLVDDLAVVYEEGVGRH